MPPSEEGGLGVLYLVYEELGQFLPLLEVVVLYEPTIVDHEEFFIQLLLVDNITGILHTPQTMGPMVVDGQFLPNHGRCHLSDVFLLQCFYFYFRHWLSLFTVCLQ